MCLSMVLFFSTSYLVVHRAAASWRVRLFTTRRGRMARRLRVSEIPHRQRPRGRVPYQVQM